VDQEARDESLDMAKRYFQLALRYAGGAGEHPTLYVFMGLSGTGKSTVAEMFAEKRALPLYSSDRVRKELVAGIPAHESRLEPYGRGIYSPQSTEKTYRALSRLAGERLILGESAVLDATYIQRQRRLGLNLLAEAAGADLVFVLCTCPEELVLERLNQRIRENGRISDGRAEIYERQKQIFSEPGIEEAHKIIRLDTNRPLAELLDILDAEL